jgi:hypothetical protein
MKTVFRMYTPDSSKSHDLFWHNAAECKRLHELRSLLDGNSRLICEDKRVVFDDKSVLH